MSNTDQLEEERRAVTLAIYGEDKGQVDEYANECHSTRQRYERMADVAIEASALPLMNAQLDAVLALHKPVRRWMPYEGAEWSFGTEREALEASHDVDINIVVMEELAANGAPHFDLCGECKRIEESPCEGECTSEIGYEAALWPCATVRAIKAAS